MNLPSRESLIGIGRTAEIYAWQEHQVIKLFYSECPPALVEHEMQISRRISAMDLPTPKFIEMLKIGGRLGLVYERVYGISMLKMINLRPWRVFRLAKQLAELHDAIHRQDGTSFPSIQPDLDAAFQRLITLPGMPVDEVMHLRKMLPDGHALCHLDFHPDQVMMTEQGPVILDWATAHQGHPLADVARTTLLMKIGQVPYGGKAMQTIINLWRGLFLETYLTRYFQLHPHENRKALLPWLVPVAVGRLQEGIPGEKESLLGLIKHVIASLGISIT